MPNTITKTQGTSLAAPQTATAGTTVKSSVLTVTTALAAIIFIHFGRKSNTALTAAVNLRVEGSSKSSGDGHWYALATFTTKIAAITSQAVNGTCNASQNVVAMTSTTGMTVGDIVLIYNSTAGNSEWHRINKINTNTSIELEDNLVNAQTGSTVYPAGEMFRADIDCSALGRIRVVDDATGAGVDTAIEVEAITADSIG